MKINEEVDQLMALIDTMNESIIEEQHVEFSEQQVFFAKKMQDVLDNASEAQLLSIIEPLKNMQKRLDQIQKKAEVLQVELKEKSLALKRARKNINAYRK